MNSALIELLRAMIQELGDRVEVIVAERDELRRERDELRHIIESAGRVLAGKEKNDE